MDLSDRLKIHSRIALMESDRDIFLEADARIAELLKALKELSISADTCELLLRQWCPDEASSLRQHVANSIAIINRAKGE